MEAQKSLKEDWFLWISLVGVTGLGLIYYFLFLPTQDTEDKPSWVFEGVKSESISALKTYRNGTLQLEIARKNGGSFTLRNPSFGHTVELQSNKVEDWISTIVNPTIQKRFKGRTEANYGFDQKSQRIEIVQNGTTHELYIGSDQPVGNGFYLRYGSNENGPVFVVAGSDKESVFKKLSDIRRKDLFKKSLSDLRWAKLSTRDEEVIYKKDGNWTLSSPKNESLSDTDRQDVKDEFRSLLTLSAKTFYDTDVPKNYEPVQLRVKMKFSEGSAMLKVGGIHEKNRLVTRTGWPVVSTTRDPVRLLSELPVKPGGWPEEIQTKKNKKGNVPSRGKASGFSGPGLPQGGSR